MSKVYLYMNAWREILARAFAGLTVQQNFSPEWLVNPATRRHLKLDYLYPEIDVAVRFTGLTAKGQRRQSDWEVLENEQRDQTRAELCRLNGVQLIILDPLDAPTKQMDNLLRMLSRARRVLGQSDRPKAKKQQGMDSLGEVHHRANRLRAALSKAPDKMMASLAEGWRDREAGLATTLQAASSLSDDVHQDDVHQEKAAKQVVVAFNPGQRVEHNKFGTGVITDISGEGNDTRISILFDADRERTFLAHLIGDKLSSAN